MALSDHLLGQNGYAVITGTDTVTGPFHIIVVTTAAVFHADTTEHAAFNNTNNISDLASVPAGTVLYGFWDDIKLSSGEVVAYYRGAGSVS